MVLIDGRKLLDMAFIARTSSRWSIMEITVVMLGVPVREKKSVVSLKTFADLFKDWRGKT